MSQVTSEDIVYINDGTNLEVYVYDVDLEDFECAGDEVLVESSPPASPDMAARLAAPAQGAGGASPSSVRELIVIPEIPNIHLQHAIQQVSSTVVDVNGDSSGHSSPTTEAQHTYIVTMQDAWEAPHVKSEPHSDHDSEGGNGVNYHVQYVEPQEIYTQTGHQTHMETLRTYPVYGVTTVPADGTVTAVTAVTAPDHDAWPAEYSFTSDQPASPAPAARMPPATVQWLLDHYETAEGVSLPRSTLYAHYLRHCSAHRLEPVNAASFGKLIRSVFVGLRTRRLGTRGNSKYHYYGIRAKPSATREPPAAVQKIDPEEPQSSDESRSREPESPVGLSGLAHRQYLGAVSAPEPPELLLADQPEDLPADAVQQFRDHHRQHGIEFLEAVAALDTAAAERARRWFWRRAGRAGARLAARRDVCAWLRRAELRLHQRAVDLLLPDVLRPIPSQLTQAIRNFAKSLEGALAAGASGAPAGAARAQALAAGALAAALRRYTSLNHLAQAARAVLNNHHQIQQMLSDLNRVDFRVVREQAAWACACGSAATAHRLEADFKARLGRGASLEAWASWLEGCVRAALAPHERRADYTPRARRLLLDWSFYSSLVIRELTLRSAASFGSFHLIRLLYDEYVSFLIERRVAEHRGEPPIAVMQRAMDDDEELPDEVLLEEEDNLGEEVVEPGEGDVEVEGEGGDAAEEGEWEWDDEEEDHDEREPAKRARLDRG